MSLNPADSRPLYHQLAAQLRDRIHTGQYAPGDQMPTEGELENSFKTSRNTVRLALNVLRAEGLLTSRQGKGTFVRVDPPTKYYASLTGSRSKRLGAHRGQDTFTQQITAQGKTARQVSAVEVVAADTEISAHLAVDDGEPVAVRRRVMYADDEPLQLGDSYYPHAIVQGSTIMNSQDISEGTDQVLEDLGHTPTRYEDEITFRMPTADETGKLRLAPGIPVGRLLRTTFDQNDQPVEVYIVILPGDRHVLHYDVSAR